MWTGLALMAVMVAADGESPGRSPYENWPGQGMAPATELPGSYLELTPLSAAMIQTAYGGQPWRPETQSRAGQGPAIVVTPHRRTPPATSVTPLAAEVCGVRMDQPSRKAPSVGITLGSSASNAAHWTGPTVATKAARAHMPRTY